MISFFRVPLMMSIVLSVLLTGCFVEDDSGVTMRMEQRSTALLPGLDGVTISVGDIGRTLEDIVRERERVIVEDVAISEGGVVLAQTPSMSLGSVLAFTHKGRTFEVHVIHIERHTFRDDIVDFRIVEVQ